MNKDDVTSFLKKSLPWIGAAATGNVPALVTLAAQTVGNALGTAVEPAGAAISAAVAGATPEQLLALKAAENDFALKMQEMQFKSAFELEQLGYQDVASARSRDVELMKTTGHTNKRANIMLAVVVVFLAALVSLMAFMHVDANSALGGVVLLLIGKFASSWETAFQFEFGSTRTSKTKDDAISALTKK